MMKPLLVAWDFFGVINAVEPSQLRTVLQQILDKGAEQVIVSHSSRSEIEQYLAFNRLNQFFVAIYGSEWHMADAGMGKSPALTDYIQTHGPFTSKYMIGDSINDMTDARQAGMKGVLLDIDQHYHNVRDEADTVIINPSDILEVITEGIK